MVQMTVENTRCADRSGSIAVAGQPQILFAKDSTRLGWRLQNTSTGDLWFNDTGGDASAGGSGCYSLQPGDYYETPQVILPHWGVSIFGATAGQTFSASEW